MKKILSLLLITILFISCKQESQSTEYLGKNKDFKVEFLFEIDGIKMYRFKDGRTHYFTNKGETINTQHYSNGKQHYSNEENID